MLPPERPDRIQIAFDDRRLVANAGMLLIGPADGVSEQTDLRNDSWANQMGYQ